ncbi:hypothetical protein B0E51_03695 [Rhodanobacter sp. C05]|nr:hypothetical protein B0E51_03695 [Rhodanobacter sp. C05]
MGKVIVRVSPEFKHPVDADCEFIAGGHLEPLYYMDSALRTAYQVYENVSEGTPVSPVFASKEDLASWFRHAQWPQESIDFLLSNGHAPSLVVRG